MAALVNDCINQVITLLKEMPEYQNKAFHVYSEEELDDKTKKLTLPCVGVVYLGMTATQENKETNKIGGSASLIISLIVQFKHTPIIENDGKSDIINTLDAIRDKFRRVKSPSGYPWRFVLEAPANTQKGILTYTQRWACPVQLV